MQKIYIYIDVTLFKVKQLFVGETGLMRSVFIFSTFPSVLPRVIQPNQWPAG